MTRFILLLSCVCFQQAFAQDKDTNAPATLKSILLMQFKTTWDQQDWFVPVANGIEGITAQQASWKPCDSCHSVGELVHHLLFWNKRLLDDFKGKGKAAFSGNNNETFDAFTEASWKSLTQQFKQMMQDWEKTIGETDDAKLQAWYDRISKMNTHNAYHTGQILYIRKQAGNWSADKGVK